MAISKPLVQRNRLIYRMMMAVKNNNMLSMDYMENDSIAFGLSDGTYQSLFEDEVADDTFSYSEKAANGVDSSDKEFLLDFSLPDDGLSQNWSLLEQLQLEHTESGADIDPVRYEGHSSRPSSVCDAFISEDTCILSPFSESSDSGVSSCHSPYGDGNSDDLNASAWIREQFMTDNELSDDLGDLLANINVLPSVDQKMSANPFDLGTRGIHEGHSSPETPVDAVFDDAPIEVKYSEQRNEVAEAGTGELVTINEVPFIEHTEIPPVIVEEVTTAKGDVLQDHPVHILPAPDCVGKKCQPVLVFKPELVMPKLAEVVAPNGLSVVKEVESSRSMPYPRRRPAKSKTPHQKEKKKHQNRNAASRYRNKKKDELNELFDEAKALEETNKCLGDKVTSLTKEIDYLKGLMLDVIKARLSRLNSQTN